MFHIYFDFMQVMTYFCESYYVKIKGNTEIILKLYLNLVLMPKHLRQFVKVKDQNSVAKPFIARCLS